MESFSLFRDPAVMSKMGGDKNNPSHRQSSAKECPIPTKVSVIPPVSRAFDNNLLFESRREDQGAHRPNGHWLDCLAEVYRKGKQSNVLFGTADVMPKDEADVLIYTAQPNSPNEVTLQKRRCPSQKAVLLLMETALGAQYTLNPKNHAAYDAVFTYVTRLVDENRYFFYPPRAYYRHRITTGLPFEQRRIACLVGTNRVGADGSFPFRTGLLAIRKGWRFSLKDWIDYVFCPGELIRFRAEVGKACASYEDSGFDIFGEGWDLLPETRKVCLGIPKESTLTYIGRYRYYFAFENHASDYGLISERIWDALWGDTVPVYRGHSGLDQFIPRECYIDARQFKKPKEMLDWLWRTPEATWEKYHTAGREFIRSSAVEKFLPEAFAERFIRQIATIAARG
jgi:hypothetical protein